MIKLASRFVTGLKVKKVDPNTRLIPSDDDDTLNSSYKVMPSSTSLKRKRRTEEEQLTLKRKLLKHWKRLFQQERMSMLRTIVGYCVNSGLLFNLKWFSIYFPKGVIRIIEIVVEKLPLILPNTKITRQRIYLSTYMILLLSMPFVILLHRPCHLSRW